MCRVNLATRWLLRMFAKRLLLYGPPGTGTTMLAKIGKAQLTAKYTIPNDYMCVCILYTVAHMCVCVWVCVCVWERERGCVWTLPTSSCLCREGCTTGASVCDTYTLYMYIHIQSFGMVDLRSICVYTLYIHTLQPLYTIYIPVYTIYLHI